MSNSNAANWALGKRVVHWGIALAVTVALIAPKPEHGEGLLHIAAGTTALALALVRLCWRLIAEVRPYVRDALRLKTPDVSKGVRGFAPLLLQGARLGGFLFLALIPTAFALGVVGIGQGEDSAFLEAHEAVGTMIMVMAIAHAVAVILFSLILKYDLLNITLFGGARALAEGGARGLWGMALGAALGAATAAYVWGPFDVTAKAAALSEQGEHGEHEDD